MSVRIVSWLQSWCPQCAVANWVTQGDPEDLSGYDVQGVECRSCGHKYLLTNEDDYVKSFFGGEFELGLEVPY